MLGVASSHPDPPEWSSPTDASCQPREDGRCASGPADLGQRHQTWPWPLTPPEAIDGAIPPSGDVYALGVMLNEMVSGAPRIERTRCREPGISPLHLPR